jgi:hypothetical protein
MRDFFIGLGVGIALTVATGWYFGVARKTPAVRQAQDSVAAGLHHAADSIESRLEAFELRGTDIKDDLQRTGEVVRRKAREVGSAVADAAGDARITATIKGKFLADRQLSAWNISVNTTDGRVTLAGRVSTHNQVGRAMLLALETGGVREVKSTIQVRP